MWFLSLFGVIGKVLTFIPGVTTAVTTYLTNRSNAEVAMNQAGVTGDVAINQAALTAFVEERKVIAAARAEDQKSRWTCWMLPVAFGLCMVHFGAIELDSTFLFNWHVAKLPAPYDAIEGQIIATAVGFSGVSTVVSRLFKK